MQNIIDLCTRIEGGYASGKSGMDNGMIDKVLELSDHARNIADALKELATLRQITADLCNECQFDYSGTETDPLFELKGRARAYIRQHMPQHVGHDWRD